MGIMVFYEVQILEKEESRMKRLIFLPEISQVEYYLAIVNKCSNRTVLLF